MPAPKCDPNNPEGDATTNAATDALGFRPDRYDILKVSPEKPLSQISYAYIGDFININHGKKEKKAFREGIDSIVDKGHVKCVYLCGNVVRHYMNIAENSPPVALWRTKQGRPFLVVTGDHPNWHLVSVENPVAVKTYRHDMELVSACSSVDDIEGLSTCSETELAKIITLQNYIVAAGLHTLLNAKGEKFTEKEFRARVYHFVLLVLRSGVGSYVPSMADRRKTWIVIFLVNGHANQFPSLKKLQQNCPGNFLWSNKDVNAYIVSLFAGGALPGADAAMEALGLEAGERAENSTV